MIIETERLILRPPDAQKDFDALAAAMADPDTVKYLGTEPMSRAQAWRGMATVIGHWSIRGYGFFSLEDKKTGEWVGRVGPWYPEGWPAREVGWTIARAHLRKGYAFEAAVAALDYVSNVLGWTEVIHVILEGNVASEGVAKKLGSEYLRSQKGIPGVTELKVNIYGQNLPRTQA